MNADLIHQLTKLRTCVAFLGEKEQLNWWPSSFLSSSGKTFLTAVFPKTSLLARINGASAAAQLIHDKDIPKGNDYHLFRLPENIEQEISHTLSTEQTLADNINSIDEAYTTLKELAKNQTTQGIGPLLIEGNEIDNNKISQMAAAYLSGFQNEQQVYPYYRGSL